jgi:hypothetical protein
LFAAGFHRQHPPASPSALFLILHYHGLRRFANR